MFPRAADCDTCQDSAHSALQQRFTAVEAAKLCAMQGVQSPLAGQVVFRSVLFGAFGAAKRWLATNPDGSTRSLTTADFYKVRLIHSVCIRS